MGGALIYTGRSNEAIIFLEKAMRINPEYPAVYLFWLGVAQFCEGQMTKTATTFERVRKRNPHLAPWFQISAYEHLGRKKEAQKVLSEYLKVRGWEKAPPLTKIMPWYQFKNQPNRELLAEGLRMAGIN
jgi:adenylate cyclase